MKFCRALFFCFIVAGCSHAPVTDNRVSYDNSTRVTLQEKAEKGDVDAQYDLGNSYCCGDNGFWDTKQAVYWWCLAAGQGHQDSKTRIDKVGGKCPIVESN